MNKRLWIISAGILCGAAVFLGLWFMGVISFSGKSEASNADTAYEIPSKAEIWEIVYGGMRFTVPADATAYIHDSGCLNISLKKDYLLQFDIEEKTNDDFWENKEEKLESIVSSGYRIEQQPERFTINERDYIKYVVSLKEDDAEYDRTYFQVLLTPIDDNRRFLVCIRYDGTDVDEMNEEERTLIYDDGLNAVVSLMNTAVSTEENDDTVGSLWMPDISGSSERVYLSQDSQDYSNGEFQVSYSLPESSCVLEYSFRGKNYLVENDSIYFNVSIYENTTETAIKRAQSHASAGFSKIHSQGQVDVNGRTFYYYTYSVLRSSKENDSYQYYFNAYCDLENGDVYAISGWSYYNETAMDSSFYTDVMDITEKAVK